MFARQECQAIPNDGSPVTGDCDNTELMLLDTITDEDTEHYRPQLAAYKQKCGAEPSERRLIIK